MEAKQSCQASDAKPSDRPSNVGPAKLRYAEVAPVKPDSTLAFFDWLCAGPVSKWERELTRRAHWRIA
jgi:hypothetical protein